MEPKPSAPGSRLSGAHSGQMNRGAPQFDKSDFPALSLCSSSSRQQQHLEGNEEKSSVVGVASHPPTRRPQQDFPALHNEQDFPALSSSSAPFPPSSFPPLSAAASNPAAAASGSSLLSMLSSSSSASSSQSVAGSGPSAINQPIASPPANNSRWQGSSSWSSSSTTPSASSSGPVSSSPSSWSSCSWSNAGPSPTGVPVQQPSQASASSSWSSWSSLSSLSSSSSTSTTSASASPSAKAKTSAPSWSSSWSSSAAAAPSCSSGSVASSPRASSSTTPITPTAAAAAAAASAYSFVPPAPTSSNSSTDSGASGSSLDEGEDNRWGLTGLLSVIRMTHPDLNTLALGTDLTTLGLNLNSTEVLYATFAYPCADNPCRREPDFVLPYCYYMQPPALKTSHLAKFQLETLFYIFYNMPKDTLQVYAAKELFNRDWRYHKELGLWFTRDSSGGSNYIYFDINSWERRLYRDNNSTLKFMTEEEHGLL